PREVPRPMTPVLEVRGTVLLDDERQTDRLRVVDGRVTFDEPRAGGRVADPEVVEGWAVPGLVDVHCHIGLGADGAVDRATAEAQALTDRDAGTLLVRDA